MEIQAIGAGSLRMNGWMRIDGVTLMLLKDTDTGNEFMEPLTDCAAWMGARRWADPDEAAEIAYLTELEARRA